MRRIIAPLMALAALVAIPITMASATPRRHTRTEAAAPRAVPVNRDLRGEFGLLRHHRTRAEAADVSGNGVLARVVGLVVGPIEATRAAVGRAPLGLHLSQAAETTVGPGQVPVWLVPGSGGACLVIVGGAAPQTGGAGCNATTDVEAGELWQLGTIPYGPRGAQSQVLVGAAADDNASVIVHWTGGGTSVVPVTDNIYSVPIGSHTGWTSVTLKNTSGDTATVPGMSKLP